MRKRVLRFESLEERRLLAVWAGNEAVPVPAPTEALPPGYRAGDVFVQAAADIDGDGFIGPAELSYMSYGWFAPGGSAGYRPASDLDGDGFIGPGDYALLSAYWFKNNDALPDETKSYEIYPSDLSNWNLYTDDVSNISVKNGTLVLDAENGLQEAVCDYSRFAGGLRVTADFKGTGGAFAAGIELAVQMSGERYCAEFRNDRAALCHVGADGTFTLLRSVSCTFDAGGTYTVWMQSSGGQVACGIGNKTLVALDDARLSGGDVGFYAESGTGTFSNMTAEVNPDRVENTPGCPCEPGVQTLFTSPSTGLSYWLFIPTDTSALSKDGYPLILFLHGGGERGDPELVKVHGPASLLETDAADEWPFITVSPSCPANTVWSADQLLALLDEVTPLLPADTGRIYATGMSMGGHGTWDLLLKAPERFAAAAPLCGWSDPSRAPLLADIPIWVFHGDSDTQVSYQRSAEMVSAIRAAGGEKVLFTLYAGVGHNCWTVTYNNSELYAWFLSQRR